MFITEESMRDITTDLKKRVISLPKLGEVKIWGYRNLQSLEARIISATVSQLANGKYYVSIAVEEKHPVVKIIPKKIIGIDLGLKDVVITSDGEKMKNR